MRHVFFIPPMLTLLSAPLLAVDPTTPVGQRDVSAEDVVTTPVTDLNLKKDDIPPALIAASQAPYNLRGLGSCRRLSSAIRELDAVLGDDVDMLQTGDKGVQAGSMAKAIVGSFIPFRGIIREISGANGQDRRLQLVIAAGVARRSFLKGTGQARGCAYPARSVRIASADKERQ